MRRFSLILPALLTMTGRVTMLGISRWTTKGGSYRTVQRFFATVFPWSELLVEFFRTQIFDTEHEFILAGDATTITKSGKWTHGIGLFFSGSLSQVVSGLEFFVFSLVDVAERRAYPVCARQTVRSEAEKAAIKLRRKKKVKKPEKTKSKLKGRPEGSLNKDKNELNLSAELLRINELLSGLIKLIRVFLSIKYVALDGHFGHHQAVLMSRKHDLHVISKLRKDTALFAKYEGEYGGRGAKKKYGNRLKYDLLPVKHLKKSEQTGEIITNYYHGIFLHKEFGQALNVVIIVKINVKTQKVGHAVLFSSDVELGWEKLLGYYSLRFQIEFNFRDAKQHFGLEDFMNTTEIGVENAANLSFLMVNVSAKLLKNGEEKCVGINDLKTHFRGVKYAVEAIKILLEKPDTVLMKEVIEEVKARISKLGCIHHRKITVFTE